MDPKTQQKEMMENGKNEIMKNLQEAIDSQLALVVHTLDPKFNNLGNSEQLGLSHLIQHVRDDLDKVFNLAFSALSDASFMSEHEQSYPDYNDDEPCCESQC